MTGNVVFLGFALAGAGGLSIVASLLALGSFLLGAFAGGWLGSRNAAHRGRLLRAATASQAGLILLALLLALLAGEPLAEGLRYALIVAAGAGDGRAERRRAAPRRARADDDRAHAHAHRPGLRSARRVGGAGSHAGRRSMAVAAMLVGALVGGLLALHVSVSATLALALAMGSAWRSRRTRCRAPARGRAAELARCAAPGPRPAPPARAT